MATLLRSATRAVETLRLHKLLALHRRHIEKDEGLSNDVLIGF